MHAHMVTGTIRLTFIKKINSSIVGIQNNKNKNNKIAMRIICRFILPIYNTNGNIYNKTYTEAELDELL